MQQNRISLSDARRIALSRQLAMPQVEPDKMGVLALIQHLDMYKSILFQ
jgi:uncharacterized protein YcaQ